MKSILPRFATLLSLFALTACSSIFGDDGPAIGVILNGQHPLAAGTLLKLDVGGRRIQLAPTIDVVPSFSGPRFGEVPVRAELVAPNGESLGSIAYTQTFPKNAASHFIVSTVGLQRPAQFCDETVVATALSVTPPGQAAPDTLFVSYGSIPERTVCL